MSADILVISSFTEEQYCEHAVEALKRERIEKFRVFAPFPIESIQNVLRRGISPVRAFVLAGGITGVITGFAVTAGTSMEWNLIVGGKPIVSLPPFIIIMFELMVLFGGISALLSFFFTAGLPVFDPIEGYSSRFGADRFGIAVQCDNAETARIQRVEAILRESGAEEVVRESFSSGGESLEARHE